MPGFLSLWPMALRRLRARWRLMLPLLVGSILAVALLSSTVIYGDGVRQLGLEHALRQESRDKLDLNLLAYYSPTEPSAYETVRNEMELAISRNVDWLVEESSRGMRGSTFFVNQVAKAGGAIEASPENIEGEEQAKKDPRLRAVFLFQTDFDQKTTLVAGERPAPVTVTRDSRGAPTSSPEVPGLILEETAAQHGLRVGDRLLIVPYWDDVSPYGVARVVGIVRPNDPGERYWLTDVAQQTARSRAQNFIPLYIPQETFLRGLGGLFPKMLADYSWSLFVDPARIDVRNVGLAEFSLQRMESQLRSRLRSFVSTTSLDSVLAAFSTRDLFGRIPLLIMVLMIVGIVFYFLVMVANAVVARDLGEMALLGSRGADPPQVLALYLWEALFVVAVAMAVGPLLALLATSLLGYTAAFSDLSGGATLPARLTVEAALLGLGGAAIAFLAMLLPVVQGLRRNLLQFKALSARPVSTSFFTRYYIDILLGIVAGLLYWELTQRGSVVSTTLLEETSVDEALLAAPALVLLAVALLFLRFFPMAVRAAGWAGGRFGKAWLALGLWEMGRNPLQYTGVILLVMLASSVAMFAANFGATVNRSYQDRARYAAGAEFRLPADDLSSQGNSVSYMERYGNIPGAEAVSPLFRARASRALQLFGSGSFQLLAVDPASFQQVAWYRDDFSGRSLGDLMGLLAADAPAQPHGLLLPEGATTVGVWALPTSPRRDLELRARVADSNGRYQDYTLGILDSSDWRYLEADLMRPEALGRTRGLVLKPPLRLVSLDINQRRGNSLAPGAVYLDDLQAGVGPSGQPVLLHPFESLGPAAVINDTPQAAADSLEVSSSVVREGRGSSSIFIWGTGSLFATRGIAFGGPTGPEAPLKAIASRSLLENEEVSRGDRVLINAARHVVAVEIAEVAEFFPTLNPYRGGFLVVNLPALLERLNTLESGSEQQPNEIWVDGPSDGPARASLSQRLGKPGDPLLVDRQRLLETFRADPLVAAGWDGILTLALIAVVFVTLAGFTVYAFVQGQRRRLEFAMLRSMGLSFRGLVALVLLEQLVVVVTGLALGSWLGVQLTSVLMPFLGLNEGGTQVLPPYVVQVDWTAILVTYSIMAAVFLVATLGLIGFFARLAIQRALRFGEV